MFGNKKKKAANLIESGATAVGTITSVRDTGTTINDNPRVEMIFRLDPTDGSAPLQASKKTTVSRVRIPQAGQRFPVFYDVEDPNTFAYVDGIADENGRALILAKFGDAFGADASGVGMIAAAAPAAAPAAAAASDPIAQIERLQALHASGALTDEEFAEQKARILTAM
jgi:hypothetical protein